MVSWAGNGIVDGWLLWHTDNQALLLTVQQLITLSAMRTCHPPVWRPNISLLRVCWSNDLRREEGVGVRHVACSSTQVSQQVAWSDAQAGCKVRCNVVPRPKHPTLRQPPVHRLLHINTDQSATIPKASATNDAS